MRTPRRFSASCEPAARFAARGPFPGVRCADACRDRSRHGRDRSRPRAGAPELRSPRHRSGDAPPTTEAGDAAPRCGRRRRPRDRAGSCGLTGGEALRRRDADGGATAAGARSSRERAACDRPVAATLEVHQQRRAQVRTWPAGASRIRNSRQFAHRVVGLACDLDHQARPRAARLDRAHGQDRRVSRP